ncbi:MAG TPA: pentapeptide repeat-containing protein, partial [Verrucomicrobiae bacterium]|nr:pentapeptide repeat-containing protein [Verrucomicrobiae bacterium]
TGHQNTGDRNTGDWNTGNQNTGHQNTGDRNTGDWNTGNRNTGNWNTSSRTSGFFCSTEPKVLSFDVQTDLTFSEYLEKYPEAYNLGAALSEKGKIDFDTFKKLPGITKAKLEKLHQAYLKGSKQA